MEILSPFAPMWNRTLWKIKATQDRIELKVPLCEESFAQEQANDDVCPEFPLTVGLPGSKFEIDRKRLLFRRSYLDVYLRKVLLNRLQKRLMH